VGATFLAFFLALLVGCAAPQHGAEPSVAYVVNVHDGDTVTALYRGRNARIRLNGIDCPETEQAYGREATDATTSLVLYKNVTIDEKGQDRRGWIIADVQFADGQSLNRELVKSGSCWWYRKHAPDDRELERLESEARATQKGLWAVPNPVPPWEWRKQHLDRTKVTPLEWYLYFWEADE
jgi:endonuclease YncB( thermonuclease family)